MKAVRRERCSVTTKEPIDRWRLWSSVRNTWRIGNSLSYFCKGKQAVVNDNVFPGRVLLVLLLVAWGVRWGIVQASPNIIWPDEIFQTLEQAHRLVFGYGVVPWEFRDGMRSWLLPGMLAGLMWPVRVFGGGPETYIPLIQAFLCLVSLSVVAVGFLWVKREHTLFAALAVGLMLTVWFELIYFAPKALSEVFAAHCFLFGLYLTEQPKEQVRSLKSVLGGILLGLSLAIRIHLLPVIVLVLLRASLKAPRKRWYVVGLAALVTVTLVGLLDWVTWSYPFQSFWLNFKVNVLEGRSETFGVSPWYAYFTTYASVWSWAGLPLIVLAAFGARRKPFIALLTLVFLLSHCVIGHKEYRFLYPLLVLWMVLAGFGLAVIVDAFSKRRALVFVVAFALVLSCSAWRSSEYTRTRTATTEAEVGETLLWEHLRGGLTALAVISQSEEICGLGLEERGWNFTGGYTYLHRQISMYMVFDQASYDETWTGFNAMLTWRGESENIPTRLGPYQWLDCWDAACLYVRPGGCEDLPNHHVNVLMEQRGE